VERNSDLVRLIPFHCMNHERSNVSFLVSYGYGLIYDILRAWSYVYDLCLDLEHGVQVDFLKVSFGLPTTWLEACSNNI
jgi:hypothetical protein